MGEAWRLHCDLNSPEIFAGGTHPTTLKGIDRIWVDIRNRDRYLPRTCGVPAAGSTTVNESVFQPLFSLSSGDKVSLPGVLALLARDEVEGFAALRPHQTPAWHMFLVQLAALA